MNLRPKRWGLLALLTATQGLAQGSDQNLQIRGFSTLGYATLLSKDKEMKEYLGISRTGTVLRDSKVGLNLSFKIDEVLSFSGQMIARGVDFFGQDFTDNRLDFDWYFLRYRPLEGLELRGGRQPIPFSLIAETQDVGFVNPWVRAPSEVYNMMPVKSMTGVQARYTVQTSLGSFEGGAYAGQDRAKYGFSLERYDKATDTAVVQKASGAVANFPKMAGGFISFNRDELTLLYANLALTSDIEANFPVSIPSGLAFPTSVNAEQPFNTSQSFDSHSIGISYDHDGFLAFAEKRLVKYKYDSLLGKNKGDLNGAYLTIGHELGRVTPLLTYAQYTESGNTVRDVFDPTTFSSAQVKSESKRNAVSMIFGLNTRLHSNVIWKLEYLKADNKRQDNFGVFAGTLYPGKSARVFSSSIDCTF